MGQGARLKQAHDVHLQSQDQSPSLLFSARICLTLRDSFRLIIMTAPTCECLPCAKGYVNQNFSNWTVHRNPWHLAEMQIHVPQVWGLRVCISHKHPGGSGAALQLLGFIQVP